MSLRWSSLRVKIHSRGLVPRSHELRDTASRIGMGRQLEREEESARLYADKETLKIGGVVFLHRFAQFSGVWG